MQSEIVVSHGKFGNRLLALREFFDFVQCLLVSPADRIGIRRKPFVVLDEFELRARIRRFPLGGNACLCGLLLL